MIACNLCMANLQIYSPKNCTRTSFNASCAGYGNEENQPISSIHSLSKF